MSSRVYPKYHIGNPQLRVFLPNFFMKILKPNCEIPQNVVLFECSMKMTKYDVKNYLEKIYKIPVVTVKTHIAMGKFIKKPGFNYITKEPDQKIATVSLPSNEKFEYPDLIPKDDRYEKEKKQFEDMKKEQKKQILAKSYRPGIPNWFSGIL